MMPAESTGAWALQGDRLVMNLNDILCCVVKIIVLRGDIHNTCRSAVPL
jgi:hypothetical protein